MKIHLENILTQNATFAHAMLMLLHKAFKVKMDIDSKPYRFHIHLSMIDLLKQVINEDIPLFNGAGFERWKNWIFYENRCKMSFDSMLWGYLKSTLSYNFSVWRPNLHRTAWTSISLTHAYGHTILHAGSLFRFFKEKFFFVFFLSATVALNLCWKLHLISTKL